MTTPQITEPSGALGGIKSWAEKNQFLAAGALQGAGSAAAALLDDSEEAEEERRAQTRQNYDVNFPEYTVEQPVAQRPPPGGRTSTASSWARRQLA